MKLHIFSILCSVFCILSVPGCEQVGWLAGGVAADETFQDWQANLEAKKAELQSQYDQVMAELQNAPDPNAVRVANQKLAAIVDQQLVNEGARLAVKAALEAPKPGAPAQDRQDFWAALIAAGVPLIYQTITKRKLNTKYISAKAGQAKLRETDPQAEAKLYSYIGQARASKGL